jgi:hypothetical protein
MSEIQRLGGLLINIRNNLAHALEYGGPENLASLVADQIKTIDTFLAPAQKGELLHDEFQTRYACPCGHTMQAVTVGDDIMVMRDGRTWDKCPFCARDLVAK